MADSYFRWRTCSSGEEERELAPPPATGAREARWIPAAFRDDTGGGKGPTSERAGGPVVACFVEPEAGCGGAERIGAAPKALAGRGLPLIALGISSIPERLTGERKGEPERMGDGENIGGGGDLMGDGD